MKSVFFYKAFPLMIWASFSGVTAATNLCGAQPLYTDTGSMLPVSSEPTAEGILLSLLLFILAGAFPVCRFIANTKDSRYLPLALTALSAAFFVLASSGFGQILTGPQVNWPYLSLSSLFFAPIGVCDYIVKTFPGNANEKWLTIAKKAHFIFAVCTVIMIAANLIPAPVLTKLFLVLLGFTLFFLIKILLLSIRTGLRYPEEILSGIIVLLLLNSLPVLSQIFQLPQLLQYPSGWGIFFLLLTTLLPLRLSKPTFTLSGSNKPISAKPDKIETDRYLPPDNHISAFAHEIKTPLGAGLLSATHMKKQLDELFDLFRGGDLKKSDLETHLQQYRELTDIITSNFQTSAELVNGFRQELSGKPLQAKQSFSIEAHIRKILASLMPKIRDSGHQIHFSCPPDLVVCSYPLYFSQIISNLIINSLNHAFSPGETGNLTLDVSAREGFIELRFSDNGKGMEAGLCQKIFEPYISTHSVSDNSGLGLFIVHSLVTSRLNGTIDCESTPGQGTHFTIKLPIERSAS